MLPNILQLCCRVQSHISKSIVEETKQALQVAGGHLVKDQQVNWAPYLNPNPLLGLYLEGWLGLNSCMLANHSHFVAMQQTGKGGGSR